MMKNPSVVIITPTIGSNHLNQCIDSVINQTYDNLVHLLVIDGEEYWQSVYNLLSPVIEKYEKNTYMLNKNVGRNHWYGHRVYASFPYLVDQDLVIFLDEDNWLKPNHIESLVKEIENGSQWSFSLRDIHSKDGEFICHDDCESLGQYSVWNNKNVFHIDTSSFCVPREFLVSGICGAWYGQWGADRQFFNALKTYYPLFSSNGLYTLNYRLDGNPGSVTKEFFLYGNIEMKIVYQNNQFPWRKESV